MSQVLDIRPGQLANDGGRREACAYLSSIMLWPADDKYDLNQRAQWRGAVVAAFERPILLVKTNLSARGVDVVAFGDKLATVASMLPEMKNRYGDGIQMGRILASFLNSKGAGGYGFILNRPNQLASPRAKLMTAMTANARPVRQSKKKERDGAAHKVGSASLSKTWTKYRPVSHLSAAHCAFRDARPTRKVEPWNFPCNPIDLWSFLRTAEKIRREAVRMKLPKADKLWCLSTPMLKALGGDEFKPATIAVCHTSHPVRP